MKNLILSITAIAALSACAVQSPENTTISGRKEIAQPEAPVIPEYKPIAPDQIQWITLDGGQSKLDFNPRIDIMFVIDNSDSMKSAQANLVNNVNSFAEKIQKNKMIDYHIGVTSVWDSAATFQKNAKVPFKNGELRQIANGAGRFVTKANAKAGLLAATLNIGIAPLKDGGPETEEVFSPISEAIKATNTGRGGANEGFFRDDAQLVVVILTDADDGTKTMDAGILASELFDFKKDRSKVSVYAALVKASDSDEYKDYGLKIHPSYHPECFTAGKNNGSCTGFGPTRLEDFVIQANAEHGSPAEIRSKHIMSLVQKSFGNDLAKIGNDITARTLAKRIELPQLPLQAKDGKYMIKVYYGTQEIAQNINSGWSYRAGGIDISGDVQYNYVEGAKFKVDMAVRK